MPSFFAILRPSCRDSCLSYPIFVTCLNLSRHFSSKHLHILSSRDIVLAGTSPPLPSIGSVLKRPALNKQVSGIAGGSLKRGSSTRTYRGVKAPERVLKTRCKPVLSPASNLTQNQIDISSLGMNMLRTSCCPWLNTNPLHLWRHQNAWVSPERPIINVWLWRMSNWSRISTTKTA